MRQRKVHRHTENPGIESTMLPESRDILKSLQKGLLGEISGVFQVATYPPTSVEYSILVLPDQLRIGIRMPRFDPFDELKILQRNGTYRLPLGFLSP